MADRKRVQLTDDEVSVLRCLHGMKHPDGRRVFTRAELAQKMDIPANTVRALVTLQRRKPKQ